MAAVPGNDSVPKADPGDRHGTVESLGIVFGSVAPGKRIGPHRHDVDEAVTVLEGHAHVELGSDRHEVAAGGVVFVPARVPHTIHNRGEGPLRLHTVFAATAVEIADLEGDPPRCGRYDLRTDTFEDLP